MRVRFAPSPTGALHIGGARTALYNWLAARHAGGTFVLRIEDTDRERSTPENVEQILDALRWLELDYDEGPIFQSQRADRHREVIEQLLAGGHAYRSNAAAEDVRAYKDRHGADRGFRGEPEETGAVRLRVPDDGATVVRDLIRGETAFQNVHMDDAVIARADGTPLYNLAVAVDDLDAGITHVIRGDDHYSNTPKQLLVLQALGAEQPVYAHLPLLHGPDGKKLSKRHGAASVQELRDAGYLPEAVRNYLALLGWGDVDDETIIPTAELVKRFELERVQKNPARFDEKKLRWMNGRYIRELPVADLTQRLEDYLHRDGKLGGAVFAAREKIQTLADFWPLVGPIYDGPVDDARAREQWLDEAGRAVLAAAREVLAEVPEWDTGHLDEALRRVVEQRSAKPKHVFQPIRVAVVGTTVSPGIFETLELLGRDETLRRLDAALVNTR
ncbi:MAG TPA: glutamate--tRNA ligase [Solirubrobacteraceae bacterium]